MMAECNLPHKDCPGAVLETRLDGVVEDVQELKALSGMRVDVAEIKTLLEEHLVPIIKKHEKKIFGDDGLVIQFDRIEIVERKRAKWLWLVIGAVTVVLIKEIVPIAKDLLVQISNGGG